MNELILEFNLIDPPLHGAISINGARRVLEEATERMLSQNEALLLRVLLDVLAMPNLAAGRLRREARVMAEAHRKGNKVDFWAAVNRICALLDDTDGDSNDARSPVIRIASGADLDLQDVIPSD